MMGPSISWGLGLSALLPPPLGAPGYSYPFKYAGTLRYKDKTLIDDVITYLTPQDFHG